jgi:hypothetical protein
MYIMVPESISTAYIINHSHQFVCLFVCPPTVARQRLGNNLPLQGIHATIEELLDVSDCMRKSVD